MKRTSYKELTLQQLRSFRETARLGSLKAAASSLRLSNPTVWEHVHSLEAHLDAQLIETHKRGCRLTDAGKILDELLLPIVNELNDLKRKFDSSIQQGTQDLSIAATPRALVEDFPDIVVAFKKHWPRVHLTLIQVRDEDVASMVASGEVDIGFSADVGSPSRHSSLSITPCYELDHVLVIPPTHPLAKRKRLRLDDLRGHTLVNAPSSIADPAVRSQLAKLGLFESTIGRVEAFTAEAIRQYVQLGFGLGLVGVHHAHTKKDNLIEQSLRRHLGPFEIHQITRKGLRLMEHQAAFIEILKSKMSNTQKSQ